MYFRAKNHLFLLFPKDFKKLFKSNRGRKHDNSKVYERFCGHKIIQIFKKSILP